MFIRFGMFILTAFVLLQPLQAQEEEGNKDKGNNHQEAKQDSLSDRLYFGGYLWAWFNRLNTRVEVSPQMGYHFTERLDAGIGGKYLYYYSSPEYGGTRYTSHIFGGNVFTSYVAIQDMNKILPVNLNGRLLVHVEYEALNIPTNRDFTEERVGSRFWSHNYFVGGGLRQQLGKRAFISFLLLYNLNEKEYSPYRNNPMIRISFGF